ncbi:MAG: sugar transferase [Alphaproteobacteria bacterium]|nr:sugar transferase [Alphaproteobacteria bacterium]
MNSLWLKRLLDITLALVLLVLVSPLFIVIVLCHWQDPGQAFYVHRRVGRGLKPFGCYKFRTMYPDAELRLQGLMAQCAQSRDQMLTYGKIFSDPRVTPLGKILRRTSLDELPQLINVLKGDMSLVGPRPVTAAELVHYGEQAGLVFSGPPGITGLWQVSGRSFNGYEQRVAWDVWYVQHHSLWLDLKILAKTPWAVVRGHGAW